MWCSRSSASTGCTATSTSRSCSTPVGCSATSSASSGCRSPRPPRWGRSPTRSARRCAASPATSRCRGWTSPRASARTTSCTNTSPGSTGRRGCCSSGGRRRRPRCSAPSAAATRPASPIRGSCAPPGWSTSSTSTPSMPTSARSSSSSAPTSPTTPSCASTATSGPSGRPPRPGSGHTALDNGFATSPTADLPAVQAICDRLGPEQIDALLRKWLAGLPHPFSPADREAGYRYDISIWQAEFSLTQVLDRPVSGRVFFEHVIRDNLDAGRPDQISLIFDRRLMRRGPRANPGPVPHSGDHRRSHPEPAHRLQTHHDQAVPQGRPRPTDRDHDQRHPRLRDRETADQSARTAGDRPLGQPAPARRPTTQPQPHPRRGSVHRRARPDHHRHRGPRRRAAPGRPPRPRPAPSPAGVPAAPERVRQPRPARPARPTARRSTRSPPGR